MVSMVASGKRRWLQESPDTVSDSARRQSGASGNQYEAAVCCFVELTEDTTGQMSVKVPLGKQFDNGEPRRTDSAGNVCGSDTHPVTPRLQEDSGPGIEVEPLKVPPSGGFLPVIALHNVGIAIPPTVYLWVRR